LVVDKNIEKLTDWGGNEGGGGRDVSKEKKKSLKNRYGK